MALDLLMLGSSEYVWRVWYRIRIFKVLSCREISHAQSWRHEAIAVRTICIFLNQVFYEAIVTLCLDLLLIVDHTESHWPHGTTYSSDSTCTREGISK